MSFQGPWLNHLDGLAHQLEEHQADQAEDPEHRADEPFYKILKDICDVVRDAEKDASPDLPEVIEKAQVLLSNALDWAYEEGHYSFVSCFSDSKEYPLIKDSKPSCGVDIIETFMDFYTKCLYPGRPRPALPPFARTAPWIRSPHPYLWSTRLARFREGLTAYASDATPLAQWVHEARAQLTTDTIRSPYDMSLSSGGSILAISAATGYKERDPSLRYYLLDEQSDDFLEARRFDPGLSNVARYITTDEERKFVFIADDDRIKSFSWASNGEGKVPRRLPNVHTMNSLRDFCGPIVILPNGRVARAGEGQAAIWTIDELERHQDNPGKLIGEGTLNTDNSWREANDPKIEMSSGSKPHSIVAFADEPTYAPKTLHLHAPTGHLLCSAPGSRSAGVYSCVAIDLEHGGRRVARYLGHGQDVEKITSSPGDPRLFATAGSDGYARIFDVRRPLPVITFQTDTSGDACSDVVFVHPDGIPTLFTGGERIEQIKVWDIRGRNMVYELSTGNNAVVSMAWDPKRSSLFVATECRRFEGMGLRSEYRKAYIPRWGTWKAAKEAAEAVKEGRSPYPEVDLASEEEDAAASTSGTKGEAQTSNTPIAETTHAEVNVKAPSAVPNEEEDEEMTYGEDEEEEDEDEDDENNDEDMEDDEQSDGFADEVEVDFFADDPMCGRYDGDDDDIDEEYSSDKRWPARPYHRENYFGYAYDAGQHELSE
ncbi:WD40 repeat-like protein [Trametes coccinea BRFM310]|uniref:WD40 repeat-like protein n=1 Tax=Trametes coccinea (strain BRFM310) TaxID=1353009 RepID=A0A1Y2IB09_TRAC3|nr:WD40 repeat-like protein [Trametes coccinea BRFM310]